MKYISIAARNFICYRLWLLAVQEGCRNEIVGPIHDKGVNNEEEEKYGFDGIADLVDVGCGGFGNRSTGR